MIFKRTIQNIIEKNLFKGKVIVIYGARRVGKTTLVKQILENYPDGKYINCVLDYTPKFLAGRKKKQQRSCIISLQPIFLKMYFNWTT
ncbi:MAG: AAA family ATPase [Mariniphaga sp.]|nr:AAA family ATPase [Mariniphaga sp.]